MFEGFVYDVDVLYDVRDVAICGVFALYELKLSSASVRVVFVELAIGSKCVADRSDQVRYVMCRPGLCRQNVFRYGGGCLPVCRFVIL